jgi:hypothetical protein
MVVNENSEQEQTICIVNYSYAVRVSRGSSVSTVSDYGLDGRDSIPDLCFQTGCGAHPSSCTVGTGGSFPGGKGRPGGDADRSPPSSAEVKKEQELCLLSPRAPPWRVTGPLYLFCAVRVGAALCDC